MYLLSDYYYDLPKERIAQFPLENRDDSKLLRIGRKNGMISHHYFKDIEQILKPDDLLVINNTKVIPARFKGFKESGGKVEVLIIDYIGGKETAIENSSLKKQEKYFECECLIRASKSPKIGTVLLLEKNINNPIEQYRNIEIKKEEKIADAVLKNDVLKAVVQDIKHSTFIVRFIYSEYYNTIDAVFEDFGHIPLPPYINRDTNRDVNKDSYTNLKNNINDNVISSIEDKKNYQTVYAYEKGAVAAPTAGLHFTESLMKNLKLKGIEFVNITLHVGYGTFVPVKVNDIREHKMHSEFFSISKESAQAVNSAKEEGRRVIAVGTTSVRTLEYNADKNSLLCSGSGRCDLFIYPGYKFKIVDAMITNFHLPESTLLMLVSAFAERDLIFKAYNEAVEKKYRFFSYGDAMFIE